MLLLGGLLKSELISLYKQLNKSRTTIMVTKNLRQFSSFDGQNLNPVPMYYSFVPCPFLIFSPNQFYSAQGITGGNLVYYESFNEKRTQTKGDEVLSKEESIIKADKEDQQNALKVRSNLKKTIKIKGRQKNLQKKSKPNPQNAERNILPNIIHQIFCFIQKEKKSKSVILQYLSKFQQHDPRMFNIDRFYRYQRLIKDKINNYINIKGLKLLNEFQQPRFEVYSMHEQKNFINMNRILIRYFLTHEFENIVLTSSRMNSDTRPLHLKIKRRILEELKETLSYI